MISVKKEKENQVIESRRRFIKFTAASLVVAAASTSSASTFSADNKGKVKDESLEIFKSNEVLRKSFSEIFYKPVQVCPLRRTSKYVC